MAASGGCPNFSIIFFASEVSLSRAATSLSDIIGLVFSISVLAFSVSAKVFQVSFILSNSKICSVFITIIGSP